MLLDMVMLYQNKVRKCSVLEQHSSLYKIPKTTRKREMLKKDPRGKFSNNVFYSTLTIKLQHTVTATFY